jgi:hypothetical protein
MHNMFCEYQKPTQVYFVGIWGINCVFSEIAFSQGKLYGSVCWMCIGKKAQLGSKWPLRLFFRNLFTCSSRPVLILAKSPINFVGHRTLVLLTNGGQIGDTMIE